jgi:L-threonylcarbamoyladenylate synthase
MILFQLGLENDNQSPLEEIAEHLSAGKIAAIPTETFYALSANPFHEESVRRIYSLKGRSSDKPVLLLVSDKEEARKLCAHAPHPFELLAQNFWPGPLTLVLEASQHIPDWIDRGTNKIALRVPGHPFTRQILEYCSFPLTGTSANRSGSLPLSSDEDVLKHFGSLLDILVMAGTLPGGPPSTLLDITEETPTLLREGRIKKKEIEKILKQKVILKF